MIDFEKTLIAIRTYRRAIPRDSGAEDQTSAVMEMVCIETPNFSETDKDGYAASFIGWTKARNLLVII